MNKACPFCGMTEHVSDSYIDEEQVGCFSCLEFVDKDVWNTRPIEDDLLARAEKAESIIRGMFPMWIAAMDFSGQRGSSAIERMRDYFNGRSNRLTADEIKLMLDIALGKEEK